MKKVTDDIAKSLKKLRAQKKLTQGQVAEAIGIEPTSYAYYEYGKRTPRPEILKNLALLFGVNVSDLYKGDDAPEFTLPEKAPLGELIRLIQNKTAGIPEDVLNLSMNFSASDEVWDFVRAALEHGLKNKAPKAKGKRKA